jgi:hypothetical protein
MSQISSEVTVAGKTASRTSALLMPGQRGDLSRDGGGALGRLGGMRLRQLISIIIGGPTSSYETDRGRRIFCAAHDPAAPRHRGAAGCLLGMA